MYCILARKKTKQIIFSVTCEWNLQIWDRFGNRKSHKLTLLHVTLSDKCVNSHVRRWATSPSCCLSVCADMLQNLFFHWQNSVAKVQHYNKNLLSGEQSCIQPTFSTLFRTKAACLLGTKDVLLLWVPTVHHYLWLPNCSNFVRCQAAINSPRMRLDAMGLYLIPPALSHLIPITQSHTSIVNIGQGFA